MIDSVKPIPGSIVKAIARIQMTIGAVKKSTKNQHGGYMFASTDDIYAAVTLKMGEVGLSIISLEDKCEIVRVEKKDKSGELTVSQWANVCYSFVLATEDATWTDDRFKRTMFIQVTGAQTFQAAQSYMEKSMLRSLFKIPTGDQDLDSMPQGDTEEEQAALNARRKPKSSSAAKKDGGDLVFNEIRGHLSRCTTKDALMQIKSTYAEEWNAMPSRWVDILDQEYEDAIDSYLERAS
jgi:ERF superfamily